MPRLILATTLPEMTWYRCQPPGLPLGIAAADLSMPCCFETLFNETSLISEIEFRNHLRPGVLNTDTTMEDFGVVDVINIARERGSYPVRLYPVSLPQDTGPDGLSVYYVCA